MTAAARVQPGAVRLTFLGAVVIDAPDHEPVVLRGAQPGLVLARLVLERPRRRTRDELAELLWPDDLAAHWEGAARQVVSRVRRALVAAGLPPTALASHEGVTSLRFGDPVSVDVERVLHDVEQAEALVGDERWPAAASLVADVLDRLRGRFLPASEAFYAVSWRRRLDAYAARARYAGALAAIASGGLEHAAELAETGLTEDPFDERATRLLMDARAKAGNRPAALVAYERLRRELDETLGVRPSSETEELHRELLGDAPTVPVAPAPPSRTPPAPADGAFIGRRRELAGFQERWRLVRDRGCQVVVVEGEPGIGKTRLLLEEARRSRDSGARVVWGVCSPDRGAMFAPFADIVEQVVADRADVVEQLGAGAGHLAPLAPNLAKVASDPVPLSSEQATSRLFRAVGRLVAAAADGPLLLVIDDFQWADDDTLALVRHVLQWLHDRPVLVALALRPPPPAVAGLLAEVDRLMPTTTLALEGLSVEDLTDLLDAARLEGVGDVAAMAASVRARTAGNPLYVNLLVLESSESGNPFDPRAVPSALMQVLERRLQALEPSLSSLLALAAVAGPTFEVAVLERCSGLPPDELLDRLEMLCGLHYLAERAVGRFGFAHDLVRDAVRAAIGETRRAQLHRRVAEALMATGAPAAEVAQQLVAAGVDAASTWSLAAGNEALAGAAWSAARDHFAYAAAASSGAAPRCDALVGLGRAQRALGDAEGARATLDDAVRLARAHGLHRGLAAATLALVGGGGRGVARDVPDAERATMLRAALADLDAKDADLLVPTLAELAFTMWLTDEHGERVALCDRALGLARRTGHAAALAIALGARRVALMGPAGTAVRVADGREALGLPRGQVPAETVLAAQLGLVEDLIELGERANADAALVAATELAADLDHPYWSWATACWRTVMTVVDGRLDEAERLAFAALEHEPDYPQALAAFGVNLVDIRAYQGRTGEVLELLVNAADEHPEVPAYRAVLALCAAEAGDVDRARAAYDHFARRGFALPADSNWLLAVAVLADAGATLGDRDGAHRLSELLTPYADRHVVLNCYGGGGAYWGPVSHHLGRLAALTGDPTGARRLLERAAAHAEAFGAPVAVARARAALAAIG